MRRGRLTAPVSVNIAVVAAERMDWPARLALGVVMLALATCAVLFAIAGTRAIAARRFTTEVTSTRETKVVGIRVAGAERHETLAFVGGDAVRVGVGLIACGVMLASWAVALGATIASRHRRVAHFLIWGSRAGLLVTVPALFPPWHIGSSLRVTGVYAAFAAIVVAVLLAKRFPRLVSLIGLLLVAAVVVPILFGLWEWRGSDFGWGVLLGIIAAAIEYIHQLIALRLSGSLREAETPRSAAIQ